MIFTKEVDRQDQITLQLAHINHLEQVYQTLQEIPTEKKFEKIALEDAIDLVGIQIEAECGDFVESFGMKIDFNEERNKWEIA